MDRQTGRGNSRPAVMEEKPMANSEELERAIERLEGLNEVFECDGNLEDSEAAGIAIALCRSALTRQENAPLIERERWIVLRDGTEVFCGLARQYHFKPIAELGNTALKTYLSKNKAIAAFEDSWGTKFDNFRYTVEKITETYVREPKGEKG